MGIVYSEWDLSGALQRRNAELEAERDRLSAELATARSEIRVQTVQRERSDRQSAATYGALQDQSRLARDLQLQVEGLQRQSQERLDRMAVLQRQLNVVTSDCNARIEDLRLVKLENQDLQARAKYAEDRYGAINRRPGGPVDVLRYQSRIADLTTERDRLRERLTTAGKARVKAEEAKATAERKLGEAQRWPLGSILPGQVITLDTTSMADAFRREERVNPRQNGKSGAMYEALNAENTRLAAELATARQQLKGANRANMEQARDLDRLRAFRRGVDKAYDTRSATPDEAASRWPGVGDAVPGCDCPQCERRRAKYYGDRASASMPRFAVDATFA